jgi:methionyl-tRNA synthetase
MQGFDVVLTTGTDEHGIKIQRSAEKADQTPEAFTTAVANEFSATWREFGFALDHEQRTTDPEHAANVQRLFKDCLANGYIYKGSYTGFYSVVNEAFVPDAKEGDVDPEPASRLKNHRRKLLLQLSAFREKLIALHETTGFPPTRNSPQRSPRLPQTGPRRPLHYPHHHPLGHPGAGRTRPRLLRLV